MDHRKKDGKRIALVATDPLRVLGLQAILADKLAMQIVPLSVPGALDAAGVSIILVDSSCVEHLFELLATFRRTRPQLKLIVLGSQTELDYIQRVIGAGAKGYLLHTASEDEIRLAVEIVQDGSVWAPRKVLARLIESAPQEAAGSPPRQVAFTPRESQVLWLLKEGHPNRVIAELLGIDETTVKAHVGRLLRKTGAGNRTALTMLAVSQDLAGERDLGGE